MAYMETDIDRYTMKYYSVLKRNEILIHKILNLENIKLRKISQIQRTTVVRFHLDKVI